MSTVTESVTRGLRRHLRAACFAEDARFAEVAHRRYGLCICSNSMMKNSRQQQLAWRWSACTYEDRVETHEDTRGRRDTMCARRAAGCPATQADRFEHVATWRNLDGLSGTRRIDDALMGGAGARCS